MLIQEYRAYYLQVSGEYMAYVASADILMCSILANYFSSNQKKIKTLTGVFGNSMEFEKKKHILRRVIIDFTELKEEYSGIHNVLSEHQERRNKFAHCPLNLNVNCFDWTISDVKEFQLLDFAKAKDINKSDYYIYDMSKHEEYKKSLGEMLVSLHKILDFVASLNNNK